MVKRKLDRRWRI